MKYMPLVCLLTICLPASHSSGADPVFSNPGDSSFKDRPKTLHYHPIPIDSLYGDEVAFLGHDSMLFFLNKTESALEGADCADFYRVAPVNKYYQLEGAVTDYYTSNDSVAARFQYVDGLLNGPCIFYYPKGKVKAKGDYLKNAKIGIWEYYYENGQKAKVIQYTGNGPLLVDCYSENGETLAQGGNGRFEGIVITNTLQNQWEYRVKGNVKDGVLDGDWQLFSPFISKPANIEKFSAGKFIRGTFFSIAGGNQKYNDRYYSRFESLNPYEAIDYYGYNDICQTAGHSLSHLRLSKIQDKSPFEFLKDGLLEILKSKNYSDYSGWIFINLKYDGSGKMLDKYIRLYQPNEAFQQDIFGMLESFDHRGAVTIDGKPVAYQEFYVALVESNHVVIPEQILLDLRMPHLFKEPPFNAR
jgi:antitoxin component YwqK of YwqJK toxin-antitoxin module